MSIFKSILIISTLSLGACVSLDNVMVRKGCGINYPHYVDNHNGTFTDTRTGLMWKRCLEGGKYQNGTCIYPKKNSDSEREKVLLLTHTDATLYADKHSFAGYSDWRLPNSDELETLILGCDKTSKKYGKERLKGFWAFNKDHYDFYYVHGMKGYNDSYDRCYGKSGQSMGVHWASAYGYWSYNYRWGGGGALKAGVLLVRSDTPSEEFNESVREIKRTAETRRQFCEKNEYKTSDDLDREAFYELLGEAEAFVRKHAPQGSAISSNGYEKFQCKVECRTYGLHTLLEGAIGYSTTLDVLAQDSSSAETKVKYDNDGLCKGTTNSAGTETNILEVYCNSKPDF